MKILLLEDDRSLNKAIKKILTMAAYDVETFFDGEDVLKHLDMKNYDLYILDINVPHINGLEILKYIQNYNKSSKVIIITSNNNLDTLKEAYSYGCIDFLTKPFYLEELQIKISKLNIIENNLIEIKLKQNIQLTKTEKKFLELLLKYRHQIVTYDMIESVVYEERYMSMDSLRAMVRRLRGKLSYDMIENVSNMGYCYKQ